MIITDAKRNAYANIQLSDTFSVKADARKDTDGGYCALFYIDGRSVALGRKETLDEAKEMVDSFIDAVTDECSVVKDFTFEYDEPEEEEAGDVPFDKVVEETLESEKEVTEVSDEEDNGEHF